MAAATSTAYNLARQALLSGGINYTSDTIKISLHTSAYTPSQSHQYFSDVSASEISSTSTGYTAGGATLGTKTLTANGNTYTARSAAAQWTAQTNGITARYAIIRKDTGTASSSPVICYILLDSAPADVTATNNGTFTVTPDATNGWFYV